ncbi:MAG: phosphopantetheine-binding protein [Coriobacteriales bacterium]|nr:phosphopantetheine-binding protein [Coriobacteriales bacterium]
MQRSDIVDRVTALIVDMTGEPQIATEPNSDLFASGLLDSLAAVELLVALEDEFSVEIPPTAVERDDIRTINSIVTQIERFTV